MQSKKIILFLFLISIFFIDHVPAHQTLTLGIHPYLPFTELEKRFTPLTDYLTKEIGESVVIRIGTSYKEHIKNIGEDKIDIAFLGPASYVELVDKYGKKPLLAIIETNATTSFTSKIIVRSDSSIEGINKLNLKKIAFVEPKSTAGYLVPVYMLLKVQNKNKILREPNFLGSHINVALGVLMGDYAAGAVKEEVFFSFKDRGLKTIATTQEIPEHIFIVSAKIPSNKIIKLQNALYKLKHDKAGRKIMTSIKKSMTGMLPVSDEYYDQLREILKSLKKSGIKR